VNDTLPRPCVVPYLYVHSADEAFEYPSAHVWRDPKRLAWRYLECVLVQVASLRLRGVDCDIIFVTNVRKRRALGRRGERLLGYIEQLGVDIRFAEYQRRARADVPQYAASYYVFDAIDALASEHRTCYLTDVDCVWVDASRVFAAGRAVGRQVGCVQLRYPTDWDVDGYSPAALARLGQRISGAPVDVPCWIGGELLAATGPQLRKVMDAALAVEGEAVAQGSPLKTEEQLLTLTNALGRVSFASMNTVAGRIWTGPSHGAANPERPLELGLWHLPGEKALAFRRAANAILRGREAILDRDLANVGTAASRFNITGVGHGRRVKDVSWIASDRMRASIAARLRK
jgi:hypothetical protein